MAQITRNIASRILPLPPQVAAQIKSSTTVPTIASVALGLIANSLDAEARKIVVSIDFGRGSVFVEDDGIGIPPKEFLGSGGLGRLHYTSKFNNSTASIGSSGTFLASVAALSILTIISHHHAYVQHASLTFHHSRPAARLIPAPSHQHLSNREHGTRVHVQDLFGNMPVRVNQRILESNSREVDKQVENLKKHVLGLLLAWHRPVSISFKISESKKDFGIRGKDTRVSEGERGAPFHNLDLLLVCGILSQAGCIDPSDWDTWVKTSARTPFITIRGAISLRPAPSKQSQFISLGLHPINGEKNGNVLYEEINRLFASSSFGQQEEILDDETTRGSKDRRCKRDGFTVKQLKGGGKGIDRWPMFYIRIEMQTTGQDRDDDVEKLEVGVVTGLLKVLGAMIMGFLDEHHFRPRARARTRKREVARSGDEAARSPQPRTDFNDLTKATTKNDGDTFGAWGRVKSGIHVKSSALSESLSSKYSPTSQAKCNDVEPSVSTQSSEPGGNSPDEPHFTQDEHIVEWTNPISGATVTLNARTGIVIDPRLIERPTSAPSRLKSLAPSSITKGPNVDHCKRLTTAPPSLGTSGAASWSKDLLNTWDNPVFSITEQPIPQIALDGPSLETSDILHGRRHCCSDTDIQKAFTQSSSTFSAKLSRNALKGSTIIAQVDQKFILVNMATGSEADGCRDNPGQLLVLIDQHAADERIRVETLLAELTISPTSLAKPIIFEISIRENDVLTRQMPHFAEWGIIYHLTPLPNSQKCRLVVKALPTPIAERCRIEPKLLIELLRGEAWRRAELGASSKTTPSNPSSQPTRSINDNPSLNSWLPRLPTCPPPLLSMLNSRACRSAIMFNDVLSKTECEVLIRKLGECAFPFQCAHGRPSMVPLVEMGGSIGREVEGEGAGWERDDERTKGFGEAWGVWKGSEMG